MISSRAYLAAIVSKSLPYPTQTQTNYRECLKSFKMVNKITKSFEVKYENIFFSAKHKLEKFYEHEIDSTYYVLATYVHSLNIAEQEFCVQALTFYIF